MMRMYERVTTKLKICLRIDGKNTPSSSFLIGELVALIFN